MVLSKDEILNAKDLKDELVDVPEWGGQVRVRSLTGWERDQYEKSITQTSKKGDVTMNLTNARAKMVALTVIDEEGARVFSDDDALALGQKSAVALNRVFSKAQELSGLTVEDVEELTQGLETAP